jgi:hypothetical protein
MGDSTQDVENDDDRLSKLLEEGVEIPDDPQAIEALLEGTAPEPEKTGKDGDAAGDGAGKEGSDQKKDADQGKQAQGVDPDKDPDEKGPPKAVLRATRESLHRAESLLTERDQELQAERARVTELEQKLTDVERKNGATQEQLQAAADEAAGKKVDLEKLDAKALDDLRKDLDDSTVDFLERLVEQHEAVKADLAELRKASESLVARSHKTDAEQQQEDIDSVPLLSVIGATRSKEADALWDRAVAYEKAVWADPDFSGKQQREIYAEVGRRLEAHLGPEATTKWTGKEKPPAGNGNGKSRDEVLEDKLAKARDSASPDSLSDLPAGSPAAQHELERLDAMSMDDLEAYLEKAAAKGQDAYDEALARLSTAER